MSVLPGADAHRTGGLIPDIIRGLEALQQVEAKNKRFLLRSQLTSSWVRV
jgi:hypothetical protein